jgi:hypothetical protein
VSLVPDGLDLEPVVVVHGFVDLFGIIAALSRPLQAVGNSCPASCCLPHH